MLGVEYCVASIVQSNIEIQMKLLNTDCDKLQAQHLIPLLSFVCQLEQASWWNLLFNFVMAQIKLGR